MIITICTIPHDQQRYETVGDWITDKKGNITINVSDMGDWRYEALVGIHEAVEAILCLDSGVTQKKVDAFDIKFEKNRKEGDESEPGDDPRAPYHNQHCFATAVERMLCAALGVSWKKYEKAVLSL